MKPCPTIYIAFTEGRYGTHISKWATAPFDGATSYSARPEAVTNELGAEGLARLFHETYERLAPQFGYETRKASAVPWEQVPENNRKLMVAVADVVRDALSKVSPLIVRGE